MLTLPFLVEMITKTVNKEGRGRKQRSQRSRFLPLRCSTSLLNVTSPTCFADCVKIPMAFICLLRKKICAEKPIEDLLCLLYSFEKRGA